MRSKTWNICDSFSSVLINESLSIWISHKSKIRYQNCNSKSEKSLYWTWFFFLTDAIHKTVFLKTSFFYFFFVFFFIWLRSSFHDIFFFIRWQRFLLFSNLYFISFFISTNWRSCTLKCHSSCINSRLNCFWYHHEIYMISFSRLSSITDNVQNKCHFFILNICMQLVITWLSQNHCQASSWWHFSFTIQKNHLKQSNKNNFLCLTFQWYQLWDFHRIEQFLRLSTFCLKWYVLFFFCFYFFSSMIWEWIQKRMICFLIDIFFQIRMCAATSKANLR